MASKHSMPRPHLAYTLNLPLRSEAVKLFYQVLVTHTTSHIVAHQDAPFRDVIITAGEHLPDNMK